MKYTNVKLILLREIRDQLRDRRTLFMIFVLPILLYPLLGMSLFQLLQFRTQKPTTVAVLGMDHLQGAPSLLKDGRFDAHLCNDAGVDPALLEVHVASGTATPALLRREVAAGQWDVGVVFPRDFAERLTAFRRAIEQQAGRAQHEDDDAEAPPAPRPVPSPEIIYTTANERSEIANSRLMAVLRRWTEEIGRGNLLAGGVPATAMQPFQVAAADVAEHTAYRGAAVWSKVLPVMLLIWALTGAFYPAVDICAGEKERGTLETLLSSPADRSEIVMGKLLTVMLCSMVTAVLNLISVAVTGAMVLRAVPGAGLPPLLAVLWLALALVPVSAMFSGLCLALAAFARSIKEAQYYLMPLLVITMPLAVLPTTPGVELNLGNSLIPVTGVVLLLRSLLEGNYWAALQYFPLVAGITLIACLLAVRWAVDQFNSEAVLFREGEQFGLGVWLRHLLRDRQPTPTVAAAVFCGLVILMVRFLMGTVVRPPQDFADFARLTAITQLAVIVTPALLMTIMLTSSPRQTLLLKLPRLESLIAALALAVCLHPVANALQYGVQRLYPVSDEIKGALGGIERVLAEPHPLWLLVLILAVLPACCEELAFRGFILSGFRHVGHRWRAIVASALFFGMTHAVLQQSLIACLLGVVLGLIAVQSGSLLPSVVFHVTHNTLAVAATRLPEWLAHSPNLLARVPWLRQIAAATGTESPTYPWQLTLVCGVLALALLWWFARRPAASSAEEQLEEAIQQGSEACPVSQ
jgi:sodium transport system permease protein